MGITGLIPFLDKASAKVHLRDLRGTTIAVDTYCWLHKGVFGCAEKLVRGEDTDHYLKYCLKYVELMLSYDIKPILVFDGQHLPAKELTERRRRDSRKASKKRAAELLRLGRTDEARSHMRRCVDVTHEMALRLIRECRQRNVDCIVAPYEADAQMAWLNKVDLAQYIVTEDSDLTLFGARKIIFKLDLTGAGLLVESDKLYLAMGCTPQKYTFDKFRQMCILSGCDYLDSLPGIGLAKACKFILKTEEDDMWKALKKIPQYLNMRHLEVDDSYIESFLKAEATFKHMYIFNPLSRQMERLNALSEFMTDERYCSNAGAPMEDQQQALQLALGNLNPFTKQQLDNWHPDKPAFGNLKATQQKQIKRAKHKSIWQNANSKHPTDEEKPHVNSKKPLSCAFFFKKIDFVGKTIAQEISANIQEENNKPFEAEVFSMYQYKSEAVEEHEDGPSKAKRQRCDSRDEPVATFTPPVSPVAAKTCHNPFAKVQTSAENHLRKSPAVCENSSLLKVLSPRKFKEEMTRKAQRMNGIKRSIFASTEAPESGEIQKVQTEVRSRFFAPNLKELSSSSSPAVTPDLREEIDEIDNLSQKKQATQAQLYESPSPQKKPYQRHKFVEISPSIADSGIESLLSVAGSEGNLEISAPHTHKTTPGPNKSSDLTERCKSSDTIVLSDDDSSDKPASEEFSTAPTRLRLNSFSSQTPPRLGLSRKPNKNSKKLTKAKSLTTTGLLPTQTRLSMFGFQKKPTLK